MPHSTKQPGTREAEMRFRALSIAANLRSLRYVNRASLTARAISEIAGLSLKRP